MYVWYQQKRICEQEKIEWQSGHGCESDKCLLFIRAGLLFGNIWWLFSSNYLKVADWGGQMKKANIVSENVLKINTNC